jgi:putative transposase
METRMKNRYDPDMHHRHTIRLRDYDYASGGAYFITICTVDRACLFGQIDGDLVCLTEFGRIVSDCWARVTEHFPHAHMDAIVVMPNHVHVVILLTGSPPADETSPRRFGSTVSGSVSAIVQATKAAISRQINIARRTPGAPVWQRNYYERVIRDETELDRAREYITLNPARWSEDRHRPTSRP